jgi:DNA-binding transcriptional LysR family regulator
LPTTTTTMRLGSAKARGITRRKAAIAGRGIAHGLDTTVRDHLREGRLVPLLEDWCQPSSELALYYPGHRHVPAALRAFVKVLQEVYATA